MLDSPDEKWTAMDLVGEKLLERWRAEGAAVDVDAVSIRIPRLARRLPLERGRRHALNADRALARYLLYPLRAVAARQPGMLFHVVDHSYAQLVHVLPAARTGVYCHDIDAFRPFLEPHLSHNSLLRPLAWTLLRGVRSAAVVFHSTHAVGDALERWGVAPRRKLVHAPYGVSREFTARSDPDDGADEVLASLGGRPYVLHVGSSVPRKRLDVLFEAFARLRARHPELRLVQQGASLSEAQRGQMARLGIDGVTLQPPKLDRKVLAGLYRRAAVVLVTSAAEGFGFPVIEALACGAPVVASDIPALREVGGEATLYAPVGDAEAFAGIAGSILAGSLQIPSLEVRSTRAAAFSWERHARTILDTYRDIAASSRRVPAGGLDPEIGSTLSRADWASFDAKRKVIGT
jgi:glycosyltransferase involved in cell wall biosynthesis